MAASCRLLTLAAAAALFFVVAVPTATMALSGGVFDITTAAPPMCLPFNGSFADHYCTRFANRTHAIFPNPRSHKTFEEADAEFRDFIPLLQSGCHDKLGTLLCFIYFPFCQVNHSGLKIYPCKETCESVTANDSVCTEYITSSGYSWNVQLQCDEDLYLPASSLHCADGVAPNYNETMNSTSTTTESPDATTTEAPSCSKDEKCTGCEYRENANGGTFKRNDYCFAAKVTVESYDPQNCKHAFSVTVEEQYDLLTPFNATHTTEAPQMGDSAVIFTDDEHCEDCPKLEEGKTYLIAGLYSKASDGSATWIVDGSNKRSSLVSVWDGKYRKVGDWVKRANADLGARKSGVCEKDAGLVSAEQWHST